MKHKTKPKYIRTSLSLPPVVHDLLTRRADEFGMNASAYVVQLIVEDAKKLSKDPK